LRLMVDIGNLAKRMMDHGDKILNKINSTGNLTYGRMQDFDVVLRMGDNSDMESDVENEKTLIFSDLILMQIMYLMSSHQQLKLCLLPLL